MGTKYLLDTNIVIYHLDNLIPPHAINKIEEILISSFNLSIISKVELLGWSKINKDDLQNIREYLSNANFINLNDDIIELAINIRQSSRLKTPDAIIAATSLINSMILVSRNAKDFSLVEGLEVYNPFL